MQAATQPARQPFTEAVRKALRSGDNPGAEADLLFLEAWEMQPSSHPGMALRASQILRANRGLAEEIRRELRQRI